MRGAAHEGFAQYDGGVGEQVPRRGVVGAVQDHVVGFEQRAGVRGCERVRDRVNVEARVDPAGRIAS